MICEQPKTYTIRNLKADGVDSEAFESLGVDLTVTDCKPFGGRRPWFVCPICRRRCGVVYLWFRWKCRICAGVRYRSEVESPHDRKLRAAVKVRKRLGQMSGGIVAPFPPKPKRMRWHTYMRIRRIAMQRELDIVIAATPPHLLRKIMQKQMAAAAISRGGKPQTW